MTGKATTLPIFIGLKNICSKPIALQRSYTYNVKQSERTTYISEKLI